MKSKFLIAIITIVSGIAALSGCGQTAAEKSVPAKAEKKNETATAGEIKRTELTENAGYAMDLSVEPQADAGKEVALVFAVKDKEGKPFDKLKIVHEKLMHLLIVSDDLAFFDHVHPEREANGGFKLNYKFPTGGAYKLYADFTPENSAQIVNVFDVPVAGEKRAETPLVADTEYTKTIDGLTFTMKPGAALQAAKGTALNFYIKDASGNPVTDLQPYLGAMAHFVVISEDGAKFLHVHAEAGETTETKGTGGHEGHGDHHGGMEMNVKPDQKNPETPTVMAHTEFPTGGLYKLWGQFQRNGKVFTVPFVLNVAQAEAKTAANNAEIPKDATRVTVPASGYEPSSISAKKGQPLKLAFFRKDANNCGGEVVFPQQNIKKTLPVSETVLVEFTPQNSGEIAFTCGMDMMRGKIVVQ